MDNKEASTGGEQRRFQVPVGEKIAYVEIISLQNKICVVELPGQEPIFITRLKDKNNTSCWVSIPQGNNEVASIVGHFIEDQFHSKRNNDRGPAPKNLKE